MFDAKSKYVFGSEAAVDAALKNGLIDAYDVFFLDEVGFGWIDRNGEKVVLKNKKQVSVVDFLPDVGEYEVIYIYNSNIFLWNGVGYTSPSSERELYVVQDTPPEDTSVLWIDTSDNNHEEIAAGDCIPVTGATAGQTIKISAVDKNGTPTEWEAVDFPVSRDDNAVSMNEDDAIALLSDAAIIKPMTDSNGAFYTTTENTIYVF